MKKNKLPAQVTMKVVIFQRVLLIGALATVTLINNNETFLTNTLLTIGFVFPFVLFDYLLVKFSKTSRHILIWTMINYVMTMLSGSTTVYLLLYDDIQGLFTDMNLQYVIAAGVPSYMGYYYHKYSRHTYDCLLEKQREAEILSLKATHQQLIAQLTPHFVFNSLSNVKALLYKQPDLSERIIDGICVMLREALQKYDKQKHSLSDEMSVVEKYLDIQKIRLGERLEYSVSFAFDVRDIDVPVWLLQPIIENAVIHGISPKKAGGTVTVTLSRLPVSADHTVKIEITDDGVGFAANSSYGFGLSNVVKRLDIMYDDYYFDIAKQDVGTKVTLTF